MAVLVLAGLAAAHAGAADKKKIAILLWQGSEPRYKEITAAVKDQLKKEGYDDSNSAISLSDAQADKEKLAAVLKKILAENPDVVVPVGTPASVAAAKTEKTRPIVFSMVFDPIESGIAKSWESSGNNTTGASGFVSIAKFLRRLGEFVPLKRIGVVYQPGQKNSELQLEAVQSTTQWSKGEVIPIPLKDVQELPKQIETLAGKVDAIYVTAGSIVAPNVPKIVEQCVKLKIPTVTHLEDNVERGVMIGLALDPKKIGELTAKKIAQVLRKTPPADIKIESPTAEMILNMKTAKSMSFQVPAGLKQWATRTIE